MNKTRVRNEQNDHKNLTVLTQVMGQAEVLACEMQHFGVMVTENFRCDPLLNVLLLKLLKWSTGQ